MKQEIDQSFDELTTTYLGSPMPKSLADLMRYNEQPPYAKEFTVRMLQLMQIAKVQPKDITPVLAWGLGNVIPRILPQAWGDIVPPITTPGRHLRYDAYMKINPWLKPTENPLFVDLGCGFPPDTTIESATRLAEDNWQTIGVDRSFAPFILYDPHGNYACFDANNELLYAQHNMQATTRATYETPSTVRSNLIDKFQAMRAELSESIPDTYSVIQEDDFELHVNRIKNYESEKVSFIEADIEHTGISNADIVRCLNVLYYFDEQGQQAIREKAGSTLKEGGLLLTGGNDPAGTHACYLVSQKENSRLIPREFAFSIENLIPCSVISWFTIHQPPIHSIIRAKAIGVIRSDNSFWGDLSGRIDQLLDEQEICKRDSSGVLQPINENMSYGELSNKTKDIWLQANREGYGQGAVDSLKKAGYDASQNCIKDIAINPDDFV